MKKTAIYVRVSSSQGLDEKDQRDELLANLGDSHEIVGEYQDIANGSQGEGEKHGLSKLLDLLIANAPRTFVEDQSRRIKRGIRAARERREAKTNQTKKEEMS